MGAGANGRAPRHEYTDSGSIVGYIPDDVSSVHSSALGGVVVSNNYPPMFSNFSETWPTLPGIGRAGPSNNAAVGSGGPRAKGNGIAGSVAGDSVAESELTDANGSVNDGKDAATGGVSLAGVSLNDITKPTSLSQSDR